MTGLLGAQAETVELHVVMPWGIQMPWLASHPKAQVYPNPLGRVRSLSNIARLRDLRRLIDAIQPDVVHLQSGVIWEAGAALARRSALVMTLHDVTNHPRLLGTLTAPEFLTNRLVRSSDAVIVHGATNKNALLARTQKERAVFSLEHGVISRYGTGCSRVEVPPGTGNVLLFGVLDKYKGVECLIEAERTLRQLLPGVSLTIAGWSPRPAYYRSLIQPDSRIDLRIGYQDDDAVINLLRWADVVVLPYLEASQSGVFQLAVAFGVPVVATNVGGFRDVIEHGVNGLLVPPRDPGRLALSIHRMLAERDLRRAVIARMQTDRDTRFNWRHIAAQTADVYRYAIDAFARSKGARSSVARESGPTHTDLADVNRQ